MSAVAPLTPPDCDLRDFAFMPVDVVRLFASEFHALSGDTGWRAGVTLWLKAWHQVPAASLPDDDIQLARLAEFGRDTRGWKKVRAEALRGWELASDGRLYHPVVAEKALEAWLEKLVQRISSGAGNAKRWGADFDQAAIEAKIDASANMLAAIAPSSKGIAKAKRRHSRKDATGIPTGKPNGHADAIPSGSQETGTGTGTGNLPQTPTAPKPAQLPADVRSVMEEGGFVSPPSDLAMLRDWYALANSMFGQTPEQTLDQDILPCIRRVRPQLSKAPFRLKVFDAAIREKMAADQRELEHLRKVQRRNSDEPRAVVGGAG